MGVSLLVVAYLIGSVTFILGLKMLSQPALARRGNLIAAGGMAIAILGTIFLYERDGEKLGNYAWIFAGLIIGTIVGTLAAKKVKMTAMPELVSLFNGMGGACAALISMVEFDHLAHAGFLEQGEPVSAGTLIAIVMGLVIGTVSFAGSVIAWGKLNGSIKDFTFKGQHLVNMLVLVMIIFVSAYIVIQGGNVGLYVFYLLFAMSIVYGVLFVFPIGGADMPVVISLLNSFTGVAAASGGFLYDNPVMLTGGILVGAAGTSTNVGEKTTGSYKEISLSDAAMVMSYANRVIIVPGYGLAVAQAQHTCHELEKLLEAKGVEVKYAIHPVAGRMPGHMNVLLAEADVSYDKLEEMEAANEEFKTTDVVLVLGANDVVNPAAKHDPASPIYGMPILEVEEAKMVIVNKRSMKPGYAGIENQLFYQPKTSMLFGDAKKALQDLIGEIKSI
jgi:NAD(P) transhydrogenase subunit beta